jgi:2-haloacid dehalogenase
VGALFAGWRDLPPWPETRAVLTTLAERVPLGVVTNCSATLGAAAVACTGIQFAAVVTAESAGFYKPRPEPYRDVLRLLDTTPARTLFVAGSAADVPGACGSRYASVLAQSHGIAARRRSAARFRSEQSGAAARSGLSLARPRIPERRCRVTNQAMVPGGWKP